VTRYRDHLFSVGWFVAVLLVMFALMGGCGAMTDEAKAIAAAEDLGYSDVKVTGKNIWFVSLQGCDEKDSAKFTVEGVSPRGERRTLMVCAGPLKGGTVRSQ
jgi:hypothetical protein